MTLLNKSLSSYVADAGRYVLNIPSRIADRLVYRPIAERTFGLWKGYVDQVADEAGYGNTDMLIRKVITGDVLQGVIYAALKPLQPVIDRTVQTMTAEEVEEIRAERKMQYVLEALERYDMKTGFADPRRECGPEIIDVIDQRTEQLYGRQIRREAQTFVRDLKTKHLRAHVESAVGPIAHQELSYAKLEDAYVQLARREVAHQLYHEFGGNIRAAALHATDSVTHEELEQLVDARVPPLVREFTTPEALESMVRTFTRSAVNDQVSENLRRVFAESNTPVYGSLNDVPDTVREASEIRLHRTVHYTVKEQIESRAIGSGANLEELAQRFKNQHEETLSQQWKGRALNDVTGTGIHATALVLSYQGLDVSITPVKRFRRFGAIAHYDLIAKPSGEVSVFVTRN